MTLRCRGETPDKITGQSVADQVLGPGSDRTCIGVFSARSLAGVKEAILPVTSRATAPVTGVTPGPATVSWSS